MWSINRRGPIIDPYGTPEITFLAEEPDFFLKMPKLWSISWNFFQPIVHMHIVLEVVGINIFFRSRKTPSYPLSILLLYYITILRGVIGIDLTVCNCW